MVRFGAILRSLPPLTSLTTSSTRTYFPVISARFAPFTPLQYFVTVQVEVFNVNFLGVGQAKATLSCDINGMARSISSISISSLPRGARPYRQATLGTSTVTARLGRHGASDHAAGHSSTIPPLAQPLGAPQTLGGRALVRPFGGARRETLESGFRDVRCGADSGFWRPLVSGGEHRNARTCPPSGGWFNLIDVHRKGGSNHWGPPQKPPVPGGADDRFPAARHHSSGARTAVSSRAPAAATFLFLPAVTL